ncbi:GDP-mannose 4,6-dehydratase, partial [bacterium]|nr:GDP-mannose 4,6-dehydratase [bacterium]
MNLIITGVAGFIGSHLAEKALSEGHDVTGIDCFTNYYPRKFKENNLSNLLTNNNFKFVNGNIIEMDLLEQFAGKDIIYHLAAQAGVRASWGDHFKIYSDYNVLGTQRVLEAARKTCVGRVVYASSSSVYGDVDEFPMKESTTPRPVSPYGVSKLAGEHLCALYNTNFGLSTVSLRFFTVYGPRQRPDMAFHKFIKTSILDETLEIYGSGEQTRDFTFVSDAVDATYSAAFAKNVSGEVFNIGGGCRISVNKVLEMMGSLLGKPLSSKRINNQKGDVRHTAADTSKAADLLGFSPKISLRDGLAREIEWL